MIAIAPDSPRRPKVYRPNPGPQRRLQNEERRQDRHDPNQRRCAKLSELERPQVHDDGYADADHNHRKTNSTLSLMVVNCLDVVRQRGFGGRSSQVATSDGLYTPRGSPVAAAKLASIDA
jgi:hypothetical protein